MKFRGSLLICLVIIATGLVTALCPSSCSCPQGNIVKCESRSLSNIPENLPNDTYSLFIDSNQIVNIPERTFIDCDQLRYVNGVSNRIHKLPLLTFNIMDNLEEVYLQNNEISSLEFACFSHLPKIQVIYLDNNRISTIKELAFNDLPSLKILSLKNNAITTTDEKSFFNIPSTFTMYLQNNEISRIESFLFENIHYLYLLNNKIRSLESNLFIKMTSLEGLDLSGNNISNIKEDAFGTLTLLSTLNLSGNPLNCDCSSFAFWSWLMQRSAIGTSAKCSNGTLVTSLQSAVLETCNPDNCPQCFNGGECVAVGYTLICECIGQWTGTFCQESQCTSYDCGFGDCYTEPVNGTAHCVCVDIHVNYCLGANTDFRQS